MENLKIIKRITYLRHEITNMLINQVGLSPEKAYTISLGTSYHSQDGDIKMTEIVNTRLQDVKLLETLLNRPQKNT